MVGKTKSEHAGENSEETKRTEKKLSVFKLKALGPGRHADGGGLYLDVQKSGSRSWIFRTTIRGKRKEIGLGGLSSRTLAQAREAAADLLAKAKKGEDILEQKRIVQRVIPTFEEAAGTVHTNLSTTFESETHAYNWLQSLKTYVFPNSVRNPLIGSIRQTFSRPLARSGWTRRTPPRAPCGGSKPFLITVKLRVSGQPL